MSGNREALLRMLVERSYFEGDFVLASGARSTYYIDMKRTSYDAEGRRLVGAAIADWLAEQELAPDSIGGLTLGADPLAHAAGSELARRGHAVREFSVRKATKDHGRMKRVEGNFEAGDRVLILDDVVTTGGSTIKAIEGVEESGGEVLAALAVVDREQGAAANIGARGVRFAALFTIGDLRAVRASSESAR